MTQEEKQLLLKDLCARLPYGVEMVYEASKISLTLSTHMLGEIIKDGNELQWKPYLRSMSSMTEEERDNLQSLHDIISNENYGDGYSPSAWNAIAEWEDYCNARHFDYRGLIEKGLALEASEDMYKTK